VVGFRHELARRATLEQIPDHRRRLLHAGALAVLAEPPVAPEMLAALAFHADQADDRAAVLGYGPAAAERAAALGANREAANLYAWYCTMPTPPPASRRSCGSKNTHSPAT